MVKVAIDQGANLKRLRELEVAGLIVLHQVHDLEQRFPRVQPKGRAATYGTSTYGGPDMYADESKFDEVLRIVGPANTVDAHHVYAAHLNRGEYFITENVDHFISGGRRERLEGLLGVKIRRTEEFLKEIFAKRGNVRHRHVGHYQFSLFPIPEGDHYRWQVSRIDMASGNVGRFGEKLADGMAPDEAEAWRLAESWLDDYLKAHPAGA